MRQTELSLSKQDRRVVDEFRAKGESKFLNRSAHGRAQGLRSLRCIR